MGKRTNTLAVAVPPSSDHLRFGLSVAVAVDGANNPMVAYIDHDPNDDKKFDDSTIYVDTVDSKTHAFAPPVIVANLVVGATICRPGDDDNCVYSSTSADGGKTWTAEVKVPDDSTDGASFQTEAATGSNGAVPVWSPNSSNGSDQCGRPEVSETKDLKTWQSCTFDKGKTLGAGGNSYGAAFAGGNDYWLVFQNDHQGEAPALGAGVWLAKLQL